ncbi:MAG: hypothetical protein MJ250_04660 [Alphaproteobacteria bacterium]|nr:hypothetical protein [Alphaproteobacteria bacterium]
MKNIGQSLKEKLLLTDEDMPLLLQGDFANLMKQNREGAVRVSICYASLLLALLIFLGLFSLVGVLFKMFLSVLIFGLLGFVAYSVGEENVVKATKYPAFSYFLVFLFGVMTFSMIHSVMSDGGFLSFLCVIVIVGGIFGGFYLMREKAKARGYTYIQLTLIGLVLTSFLLSFQSAFVQMGTEHEIKVHKQRVELQRAREAEKMKDLLSESKACTNEEDCKKANTKKNTYYQQYEEEAQNSCENAVARELPGRFEWTVGKNDYKFDRFQVDVVNDKITLFGDKAQLIETGNIKIKVNYTCTYDTKKRITSASYHK